MRKHIVAGNWKMNTTLQQGIELAKQVNTLVKEKTNSNVGIILAPPFTHLTEIINHIDITRIGVAAQNCSSEPKGAYTGEVAAEMIKSTGATHVIIGHSERRSYFKETNTTLAKKIRQALNNQLIPIYCCGETLEERNSGVLFNIIKNQIEEALYILDDNDFKKIIIAYEPVWAIGTGVNASPQQAQEMHAYIRNLIAQKFGNDIVNNTTILYGGSCKASNARELFANPDVDGGLIGGASLIAQEFVDIINSF